MEAETNPLASHLRSLLGHFGRCHSGGHIGSPSPGVNMTSGISIRAMPWRDTSQSLHACVPPRSWWVLGEDANPGGHYVARRAQSWAPSWDLASVLKPDVISVTGPVSAAVGGLGQIGCGENNSRR